jgi:hypothetical protein
LPAFIAILAIGRKNPGLSTPASDVLHRLLEFSVFLGGSVTTASATVTCALKNSAMIVLQMTV